MKLPLAAVSGSLESSLACGLLKQTLLGLCDVIVELDDALVVVDSSENLGSFLLRARWVQEEAQSAQGQPSVGLRIPGAGLRRVSLTPAI